MDDEAFALDDGEEDGTDEDPRDYGKIAQSLPVFCVSTRGYLHLQGKLDKDDSPVKGFLNEDATEIPQLREYAKQLAKNSQSAREKRLLNELRRNLMSLAISFMDSQPNVAASVDEAKDHEIQLHLELALNQLKTVWKRPCCSLGYHHILIYRLHHRALDRKRTNWSATCAKCSKEISLPNILKLSKGQAVRH